MLIFCIFVYRQKAIVEVEAEIASIDAQCELVVTQLARLRAEREIMEQQQALLSQPSLKDIPKQFFKLEIKTKWVRGKPSCVKVFQSAPPNCCEVSRPTTNHLTIMTRKFLKLFFF